MPVVQKAAETGTHKRSALALLVGVAAIHAWLLDKSEERRSRYAELVRLTKRKMPRRELERLNREKRQLSKDGVTQLEARIWQAYGRANYRSWLSLADVVALYGAYLAVVTPREKHRDEDAERQFHKIRLRIDRMVTKQPPANWSDFGGKEFARLFNLTFKSKLGGAAPSLGPEIEPKRQKQFDTMHDMYMRTMRAERRRRDI